MKTLYININGKAIHSDGNIEVIGSAEDAIVDSFYISLGMAIADGMTGIKYKPLVADFAKAKPEEFKSFTKQWNEIKALLLGDNPSGDVEFVLTPEYLEWLKMNSSYSDIYYKKYQGQHEAKVNLSLDELYEDTVDAIRRKVIRFLGTNDNYKNFDEFVVNDATVTRRSLIVRSIKSKFEDVAFVLYEKWMESKDVCPKCGNLPCECEQVCPKCGKNPCECVQEQAFFAVQTYDDVIRLYDSKGNLFGNSSFLLVDNYNLDELNNYYKDGLFYNKGEFAYTQNEQIHTPVFTKCLEDNKLYIITNKEILPFCDYEHGEVSNRKSAFNEENTTKHFYRKGNLFAIVTDRKGSDIYEYNGDSIDFLFHTKLEVHSYELGSKYTFDDEDDVYDSVIINIETFQKTRFKGLDVYPIGVLRGNDAFVVAKEGQESNFSIVTIDGKKLDWVDIDKDDLYSIEVINNTTLNVSGGFYLLDHHILCEDYSDNLYVKDGSVYERSSGRLLYTLWLDNFDEIGNGWYTIYISKDGEDIQIIIDENGKLLYICEADESVCGCFSDGLLALFDNEGVLRRIIDENFEDVVSWPRGYRDLRCSQEQYVYGNLVVIDDYKNQVVLIDRKGQEHEVPYYFVEKIERAYMFFKNVIYVKDEYDKEYLIREDGSEVIPHLSYRNIRKLSEDFFYAWPVEGDEDVVSDSNGNVVRFNKDHQERIQSIAVL